MRVPARTSFLLALAFLVHTGCAGGSASSGSTPGASGTATIQVQNNSPGAGPIDVFLSPEVGQRVSLGSVQPNATGTFSYNAQPGYYTLEAQLSGGTTTRSERFRLTNTDLASWNMSAGSRVIVGARR